LAILRHTKKLAFILEHFAREGCNFLFVPHDISRPKEIKAVKGEVNGADPEDFALDDPLAIGDILALDILADQEDPARNLPGEENKDKGKRKKGHTQSGHGDDLFGRSSRRGRAARLCLVPETPPKIKKDVDRDFKEQTTPRAFL
jgi:hypothetical protein